jgi:formamidopyrimidine-DNA glycosylase
VPELPDLTIYVESLEKRVVGKTLNKIVVINPFLLRSVDPPLEELQGRNVRTIERIGKRIVFGLEDELYMVIHLMIAGRLKWKVDKKLPPRKIGLAVFSFEDGDLQLTEAGTKRRASLHAVRGAENLHQFDRGGLEVYKADREAFAAALLTENHTLKRTLTDQRLFSGIGNSYSDEILHRAHLSPFKQSTHLKDEEIDRLYQATLDVLQEWVDRLRLENGDGFPAKVTAFRKEMAVHGKYGEPCPVCSTPVQRIRYAENECNYCPTCQTDGRLLADRALSRLLKNDWPSSVEQLEALKSNPAEPGSALT